MLNISGEGTFSQKFAQLNMVPLTISYEYEPCDVLKVQELYLSGLHTKYVKAPGEDLNSILTGILQAKGKIHVSIGKPIGEELKAMDSIATDNDKIKALTALIDKQIYTNYQLWPINYVAADMIANNQTYAAQYTHQQKQDFIAYINSKIDKLEGDKETLFNLFLKMYANPVQTKN